MWCLVKVKPGTVQESMCLLLPLTFRRDFTFGRIQFLSHFCQLTFSVCVDSHQLLHQWLCLSKMPYIYIYKVLTFFTSHSFTKYVLHIHGCSCPVPVTPLLNVYVCSWLLTLCGNLTLDACVLYFLSCCWQQLTIECCLMQYFYCY